MSELVRLLIACLACYRLSELIAVDDGPGDILSTMRAKLGAYDLGEDGRPQTSLGRGIICPYCIGIWLAFFFAFAIMPNPVDWQLILYWLAIAGGQAFLQSVGGRV